MFIFNPNYNPYLSGGNFGNQPNNCAAGLNDYTPMWSIQTVIPATRKPSKRVKRIAPRIRSYKCGR